PRAADDEDPLSAAVSDRVPLAGEGAADRVVAGEAEPGRAVAAVGDQDARLGVPQGGAARHVRPDAVALDLVPRRVSAEDQDAAVAVAGDDVAGAGRDSPERVIGRVV